MPSICCDVQLQVLGNKLVAKDYLGSPWQGFSVSLSNEGLYLAVGGPYDYDKSIDAAMGAAWVYTRAGDGWKQTCGKLVGSDPVYNKITVNQGSSVSLSAEAPYLAVGGPGDADAVGAAWIFEVKDCKQFGNKLVGKDGQGASAFGSSVSLSADGSGR